MLNGNTFSQTPAFYSSNSCSKYNGSNTVPGGSPVNAAVCCQILFTVQRQKNWQKDLDVA